MAATPPETRDILWRNFVPLLLFVVLGTAYFWNGQGDDLASSYVGCRVLAGGHGASLYSYDPVNFAGISDADTAWPQAAAEGNYHGWLHPYVQTPLWAWMLHPLCVGMQWPAFKHLFLLLSLLSVAGCVFLVARYWTPSLFHPVSLSLIVLALSFSEPFLFAMTLVQTHALLLFLTVGGILLAQQDRPVWAGLCVALAAAVKITPGVLLVYWIASRRWKAALSLLAWSALLSVGTRVAVGASLFHEYLANMHRVSNVLLVSENNQSLASWYMSRFFSSDEVFDVTAFPLPATLRTLSMLCMLICTAFAGLLDGRPRSVADAEDASGARFCGAGIVLVAMTVFAPIAWTHYYLVLVIPLMMLVVSAWQARTPRRRWLLALAATAIAALQYRPFAPDVIRMDLSDYAFLHGIFYSAILCVGALFFVSVRQDHDSVRE